MSHLQAVCNQNIHWLYNGMSSQIQAKNGTKRIHMVNLGNHSGCLENLPSEFVHNLESYLDIYFYK